MEAVSRGWDLSMRRAVALFLGLVAIVMLAGGAAAYLTRGVTTLVVKETVIRPASPTTQPTPDMRTTGGYIPGL
jgi:fatty acid/phospholipid biosynthesis enzyme